MPRASPAQAQAGDHHYLSVRPRMQGHNRRAIGARISVQAGGRTMTRGITAGTSYLGQEPAEAFFGMGTTELVELVTIYWPDGESTALSDVAVDQLLTVNQTLLFDDGFELGPTN